MPAKLQQLQLDSTKCYSNKEKSEMNSLTHSEANF